MPHPFTHPSTPGPWRVSGLVTKAFHILNEGGYVIATVNRLNAYKKAQLSNARLIAASPELLVALRDMVHYDDLPESEQAPAMVRARAAITKAEGRT